MALEKYFEKQGNIYITKFGGEILEKEPNFIRDVWENEEYRNLWFHKSPKIFTKINWGRRNFVEKSSAEGEIQKYARMNDIMEGKYKNIKLAEVYFQKEDKILLKHYNNPYIIALHGRNTIEPNDLALEELEDLLMAWIAMDFCVEENGDLIVIDPHC